MQLPCASNSRTRCQICGRDEGRLRTVAYWDLRPDLCLTSKVEVGSFIPPDKVTLSNCSTSVRYSELAVPYIVDPLASTNLSPSRQSRSSPSNMTGFAKPSVSRMRGQRVIAPVARRAPPTPTMPFPLRLL